MMYKFTEEELRFIRDNIIENDIENLSDPELDSSIDKDFEDVPDNADSVPWEDVVYDILHNRTRAEGNLKLQLNRLETAAFEEIGKADDMGEAAPPLAIAVITRVEQIRRALTIMDLLPDEKTCECTLDALIEFRD